MKAALHTSSKAKQATPHPKGRNSNQHDQVWRYAQKQHEEQGWLQGSQKGSKERRWEDKAVQEK